MFLTLQVNERKNGAIGEFGPRQAGKEGKRETKNIFLLLTNSWQQVDHLEEDGRAVACFRLSKQVSSFLIWLSSSRLWVSSSGLLELYLELVSGTASHSV